MRIMLVDFWPVVDSKGGTEKVLCDMANEFNRRGHEIIVICCEKKEGVPFFPLDPNIEFINIGINLMDRSIFFKMKREFVRLFNKKKCKQLSEIKHERCVGFSMKTLIGEKEPDIIIAYQPYVTSLLRNTLKLSIPIVTMFHLAPRDLLLDTSDRYRKAINESECSQVLLPSFLQELKMYCTPKKAVVIPNAVPQFKKEILLNKNKEKYKIITIGRLDEKQKRPHLLIEIFNKLNNLYPRWELELWGQVVDKRYYNQLMNLVNKYELNNKIRFMGTSRNIIDVLKEADIFVFPSAYEGFGLTLAEAMSVGIPSVGFENCVAVNELIKNGYNGFLCEDGIEDMTEKLSLLMSDYNLRVKFGRNAHLSMKKYEGREIWNKWEVLLQEILNDKRYNLK